MTNREAIKELQLFAGKMECPSLEAVNMAIEALIWTEWIPVSERLPKENGEYIVSLEDSVYPQASFFNGKWFMRSLNGIAREFGEYEVIAWMRLPEPWKGENNDRT